MHTTQTLSIKTQEVNISILIANKVILKAGSIIRDKVRYFTINLFKEKKIIILNLYACNDIR